MSNKNTLILEPRNEFEDGLDSELLSQADTVLVITHSLSKEVINDWRDCTGDLPENFGVISIGEMVRSASASVQSSSTIDLENLSITVVRDGDLTGVEITISEYLVRWDDTDQLVLWFDSVTDLLESTNLQTTWRFLHLVASKVRCSDARAFYLVDPLAHKEKTITHLTYMFDSTIE